MATIKPFRAIRPAEKHIEDVAALPYDVMNSNEARKMVKDKPYSFLHIDKAEVDLDPSIDIYDERVYEKAKENFEKMKNDKIFIQDEKESFYIYELVMDGRSQKGLVVCTSIDEYLDETIKKHELTRADKEADRIKHVDTLNANTGPIFLAYEAKEEISKIINDYTVNNKAIYDFVSEDGITHRVWRIQDDNMTELIKLFEKVPSLYIADGHHRNKSAVEVGLKRRNENPNYHAGAEFNYYLSVLFPDNELYIMDYNRVVKDLNNNSVDEFIAKIKESFLLEEKANKYKPEKPNTFGMYIDKKWYKLTAKPEIIEDDIINSLDVSILQKNILENILGIEDVRISDRIDFVGGIRGIDELSRIVDTGEMAVAFCMFPTSMKQLFDIADAGKLMPPKSTWFEPKLRSGIFIHEL